MSGITIARARLRAGTIAMIIIAGLGGAGSTLAVEGLASKATTRNPITIYTHDAAARAPGGLVEQLMQRAQARGRVRVIAGLRMAMRMEHTLTPSQAATQLHALQTLQGGVATRVLGAAGAQSGDRFTFIPYMSMFVNAAQLGRLLADPQVVSVQEDVPLPPALAQSAPLVHADDVWDLGFDGTDQVIAVLDTGVSKTHPMLAGKVVSEACYSTSDESNDIFSLCPGGVTASTAAGSGVNCPRNVPGCGHGTHVAGIAAGDSATLDGIARGANLIAIQVFSRFTDPDEVRAFGTDRIKGLQRVYALRNKHKIAAVNMSIGSGAYDTACDDLFPAETTAITKLRSAGIATTIASGNDGLTGYIAAPACISTAVAVGNTTKNDLVWESSNHSTLVTLLAPGTDIKSAVPGKKYEFMTGTSMAAPHVAGAFAALRDAKPAATIDEILEGLSCGKIVNRRFVTDSDPVKLESSKRARIDLLTAYSYLKPAGFERSWQFDTAAELLDWSPLHGKWVQQTGGHYGPKPERPRYFGVGSQIGNCIRDTQTTVRVRRVETETMKGEHMETGVVVRAQASYLRETVSGYVAAFMRCRANETGNCTFSDEPLPWGRALFYRIDEQKPSEGFPVRMTLCEKSTAVNVGGYNTIKVISRGTKHSYYLNGTLVCTVTDDVYPYSGDVMLFGAPADLRTYGLSFDSVAIKSLGRSALESADDSGNVMDPAAFAPASLSAQRPPK